MRKAQAAENRVQRPCQSHGLAAGLTRQVQVAAVQSVALYGAELWWQGQKDRLAGIQLMISRQARAITGMLKSTQIGPLVRSTGRGSTGGLTVTIYYPAAELTREPPSQENPSNELVRRGSTRPAWGADPRGPTMA